MSTNSGRPADTAVTDSIGFILVWGGVGQFVLGESHSRLYPHMSAKFWRGPTAVSKKVSLKFISRYVIQVRPTDDFSSTGTRLVYIIILSKSHEK